MMAREKYLNPPGIENQKEKALSTDQWATPKRSFRNKA